MNPGDIAALAANAGFTGSDVGVAAAIALAESGGNPSAYNPESQAGTPQGQGSFGLWQIYLKAHPEFSGWNLLDPQTNANAAFQVYQQQGFSAWSTFNSGKYTAFLAQAASSAPLTIDATTGLPVTDLSPTPGAAVNGGSSATQILFLTAAAFGLYLLADSLAD